MMSDGANEQVQTAVGSTVYETEKRVKNPVSDEYERIDEMSTDGYKRRFLALRSATHSPDVIDLSSSPVASFDKDKWDLRDEGDSYVLVKSEAADE